MTVGYDLPGQRALDATLHQILAGQKLAGPEAAAAAAASLGRVKIYSTGTLTTAAASNVRMTLENPTGSGHKLTLLGLELGSTVTGFCDIRVNPTTGLPASAARPALNALVGAGSAPVAVVKADESAVTGLGGGTATGVRLHVGANQPRDVNLVTPLILTAGVTLGISLNLSAAFTFAARFTFLEEPV